MPPMEPFETDVEGQDDYIILERTRAEGLQTSTRKETQKQPKKETRPGFPKLDPTNTDYVLVEQAAVLSSFEKYGTHFLIWLSFATSLWGAIFVITICTVFQSKKNFDATAVVCIPMLMIWALASMWSSYKNKSYRKATVLSFLPVMILIAILVWWYFPI